MRFRDPVELDANARNQARLYDETLRVRFENHTVSQVVSKVDTTKCNGIRPKESECVYACQCGTKMPMFVGICDRTEIPRQVLQAMEGHARKHQQEADPPVRAKLFSNLSLLRTNAAVRDNWADIAT